jgi:hypothetical protein
MHYIEPYFRWRDYYIAEEDKRSPFFRRKYNEFDFTQAIYNYVIHPQWDDIGSDTLYIKILYVDYSEAYAIIEMIGEWNDCISNDIMFLKRDILDHLIHEGINKFILIAENVLNFHFDMDDYYAELYDDLEDGWVSILNMQHHVYDEFCRYHLYNYLYISENMNNIYWRNTTPMSLFHEIEKKLNYRIES